MRLLNIDLHISVVADVTDILKDEGVEITNWSISGHNWVFNKPTADVKVVNQYTWKNITPSMIEEFAETYRDAFSEYDGFLVTHTPVFALLYESFKKPIIVVNSCRYEQPFSWSGDIDGWNWLNDKLKTMKNVHFVSNNRADQEYLKMGAGVDSTYIPSLCLYTGAKWTGTRDGVIQHGTYPGRYTWQDLYSFKGIVHVPYEISTMSIFEQYSANVPLFFPTKRFLKQMGTLKSVYGTLHPNLAPCADIDWWIERADYYHLPHITYFDSEADLREKLANTDFEAVSRAMAAYNETRERDVREKWHLITNTLN
jgi:hypothetical protein